MIEPKRDDRVRIGPVGHPDHEWVGSFVRWEDVRREHFIVDTLEAPGWPSQRYTVRAECLRGFAGE